MTGEASGRVGSCQYEIKIAFRKATACAASFIHGGVKQG